MVIDNPMITEMLMGTDNRMRTEIIMVTDNPMIIETQMVTDNRMRTEIIMVTIGKRMHGNVNEPHLQSTTSPI